MIIYKDTATLNYINDLLIGVVVEENLPKNKKDIYSVNVILLNNGQILYKVPVQYGCKSKNNYEFTRLTPATKIYDPNGSATEIKKIKRNKTITDYIQSDGERVLISFLNSNRTKPIVVGIIQNPYIDITNKIEGEQSLLKVSGLDISSTESLSWVAGNLIVFKKDGSIVIEHRKPDDINKILWKIFIDNDYTKLTDSNNNVVLQVQNGNSSSTLEPAVLGDTLVDILNTIKTTYNDHTHALDMEHLVTFGPNLESTLIYDADTIKSRNIKISK